MKKIYLFMVLLAVPFLTMCSGPMMGGWDRAGNYGCGFGYGYGGIFMGIVVLIILGAAIYFIAKNINWKTEAGQAKESPLDILKKRYAKGEITKEDFDRMKTELQ